MLKINLKALPSQIRATTPPAIAKGTIAKVFQLFTSRAMDALHTCQITNQIITAIAAITRNRDGKLRAGAMKIQGKLAKPVRVSKASRSTFFWKTPANC